MSTEQEVSKSLFADTKANALNDKEETSTMLLLLNAIGELRQNKNIKKAIVEFNQSYLASNENDDIFLSKLLELSYEDLELLFLFLCGPEKNRRSSKQQHRNGFRKKTSVGDLSYLNAAYESEGKLNYQSNSLGRKRSQLSLQEENTPGSNCLRKAFCLYRNYDKTELSERNFRQILEVHLKVENYSPCVLLFTKNEMKGFQEKLLLTLDDSQKFRMYQLCIFIANNITKKQTALTNIQIHACVQHCKLACKLAPHKERPYELLCRIHRHANETEKALAVLDLFFDKKKEKAVSISVQKVFCLVDIGDVNTALSTLDVLIREHSSENTKELEYLRVFIQILKRETKLALSTFKTKKFDEDKTTIVNFLLQFYTTELKIIQNQIAVYYEELISETNKSELINNKLLINEVKKLLMATSHLLIIKNPDDLMYAKIYVDSLFLCDEPDISQAFLVKLVKENSSERLPMIYLANLRLKLGAYMAATEDFRTLYTMWGAEELGSDLTVLSVEDRHEIARVHQLHGVKFLKNKCDFQASSECFSVALAAIGMNSTSLLLSRGLCHMHLNDFEHAQEDLDRCLAIDESISAALCARAVLYAATTHVEEAISNFRKSFSIDANACLQCIIKLPLEHVSTFTQLISQYVKQEIDNIRKLKTKKYDINAMNALKPEELTKEIDKEVVLYMEFVCKIFPKEIDHRSTYIECLYISKEYSAALYETNHLLLTYQNEACLHLWKTVLLIQQRKLEDAMNQLKSISSIPEEVLPIMAYIDSKSKQQLYEKVSHKGQVCREAEKYGEALQYYNIAVTLNGKDVNALRGRLECYLKIHETKKWLRDLSQIIQLQPTAEDLCIRARYYQSLGEDMRACEDYINALEIEQEKTIENITTNSNGGEVVKLFESCAWCMVDLSKPRDVFRLCDAGLKFDPNHKSLKQLKKNTHSHVGKCVLQ